MVDSWRLEAKDPELSLYANCIAHPSFRSTLGCRVRSRYRREADAEHVRNFLLPRFTTNSIIYSSVPDSNSLMHLWAVKRYPHTEWRMAKDWSVRGKSTLFHLVGS